MEIEIVLYQELLDLCIEFYRQAFHTPFVMLNNILNRMIVVPPAGLQESQEIHVSPNGFVLKQSHIIILLNKFSLKLTEFFCFELRQL